MTLPVTQLGWVMHDMGIKQQELAKGIGVERSVVSKWMRGLRRITPEHQLEVARFLGVKPSMLWVVVEEVEMPLPSRPMPPLIWSWRAVCMLCGRDRWYEMSVPDARQWRQEIRCEVCGGRCLVEQDGGDRRRDDAA